MSCFPVITAIMNTQQYTYSTQAASGDNYGARIRGYLCPPQTGTYTFWIAGDDNCELWLSTDDALANKTRIAHVQDWTGSREWYKYPAQQSARMYLVAGRRYFVEALHKEQGGNDHVAVAWRLPDGTMQGPIPGNRLSPYVEPVVKGTSTGTPASTLTLAGTTVVELTASPNPFSNECYVRFKLMTPGPATLAVYDSKGRSLRQLFTGMVEAFVQQEVVLKSDDLPSGIYTILLTTDTEVVHQRVILTK